MSIQRAIDLIERAREQQDRGVHEQASPLLEEAIRILRKYLPASRKYLAIALNDYGRLKGEGGDLSSAADMLHEALKHQKAIFDKTHHEIAVTYNNLGLVYKINKQYKDANHFYRKAFKLFQTQDKLTPAMVKNQSSLAVTFEALDEVDKAYTHFESTLEKLKQVSADNSPEAAIALYSLAALCVTKRPNSPYSPLELMLKANAIDDALIEHYFATSSETGRLRFLGTRSSHQQIFLSFIHFQMQNGLPVSSAEAYSLVLRRKGLATEMSASLQTAVWRGNNPKHKQLLIELSQIRQKIARKSINPKVPTEQLNPLLKEKEILETELAKAAAPRLLSHKLKNIRHDKIGQALPKNSALIEFVRFEAYDFMAVLANGDPRQQPSRYLAFVIKADQPENLQLFDLGPTLNIDERVGEIHANMDEAKNKEYEPITNIPELKSVWSAVSGCSHLFIAPDSNLAHLSFAIVQDENGRHLLETFTISYLLTGRDLLFSPPSTQNSTPALVIAEADYSAGLIPTQPCKPLFKPLENVEGNTVARELRTTSVTGKMATVQRLKAQQSPRILHLSTHGFFFSFTSSKKSKSKTPTSINHIRQNRNALLRGGLAFAGANRWACDQLPKEAENSGILTAEEIRNLNLADTEMVVLSACQSGVGDALAGEAVFGFRRAFTIAGARTLVISLWKVPEFGTRKLMVKFYEYLDSDEGKNNGLSRAKALQQAQLDLKQEGLSFYHWGAFICQGNVEPLQI